MEKNIFAHIIATALNLQERAVANTLALLEEGCTIPFISRYRKERTGGLDEVQIAAISDRFDRLQEILKRKETVVTHEGTGGQRTRSGTAGTTSDAAARARPRTGSRAFRER